MQVLSVQQSGVTAQAVQPGTLHIAAFPVQVGIISPISHTPHSPQSIPKQLSTMLNSLNTETGRYAANEPIGTYTVAKFGTPEKTSPPNVGRVAPLKVIDVRLVQP
jgi:hypothetical protein